jgi:hypothetical protein
MANIIVAVVGSAACLALLGVVARILVKDRRR